MTEAREHPDDIDVLDVLVFLATNIRLLVAVPLIIAALTYGVITLLPEEHTAFYRLEFPPSVHPYIADPIVIAAIKNDTLARASIVNGGVTWFFKARSEKDAVNAVTTARNAALDAVSSMTPTDVVLEAGNYMGLSAAGVAWQVSTIKKWAEFLKKEPVTTTSNLKRGAWMATTAALSLILTLLFLIMRNVVRSAELTPEGAAKMARIKASLPWMRR